LFIDQTYTVRHATTAPMLWRFELDERFVNPPPAVVSPPHPAPHDRAVDRAPREDHMPDVPEVSPGGTEACIKLIVKIVQHEATLANSYS
ncbi:MAG: hypothetical protein WBE02_01880, partial [Bradyrhizobium sp.]